MTLKIPFAVAFEFGGDWTYLNEYTGSVEELIKKAKFIAYGFYDVWDVDQRRQMTLDEMQSASDLYEARHGLDIDGVLAVVFIGDIDDYQMNNDIEECANDSSQPI